MYSSSNNGKANCPLPPSKTVVCYVVINLTTPIQELLSLPSIDSKGIRIKFKRATKNTNNSFQSLEYTFFHLVQDPILTSHRSGSKDPELRIHSRKIRKIGKRQPLGYRT
jgi:hypothetical protein